MLKALVIKELRESVGVVALAVFGGGLMLASLTGTTILPLLPVGRDLSPFIADSLSFYLCLLAGGLGIALGWKQSAWELWHGNFYFLLHRPVARRRVFAAKLLTGGVLVLLVSGGFVLVYALWATLPGRHATPFLWSMTGSAWQLWFALSLLYLGAFMSGIRPGRWFGSRLFPLAATVPLVILSANMAWWWLGTAVVLVGAAVLTASIVHYAEARDY